MAVTQKMSIHDVDPDAYRAVLGLEQYVRSGDLGERLLAPVEIRASQINHCAWCLDMHTADARPAGLDQRPIDLVAARAEAGTMFSRREQAALAFAEQVTRISEGGVSDEVWAELTEIFDEKATVLLLTAVAAINVWNRMNVTVHTELPPAPATPS